jgi:hypothetical protein
MPTVLTFTPLASLNKMVEEAIREQKMITFEYHRYFRKVKPFIVGLNHQGNEVLSGIQVAGGGSGKTRLPSWKTFRLEEIEYAQLTDETFKPSQRDYNPDDPNFEVIYTQI